MFELVSCLEIPGEMIVEYEKEFRDAGEQCYVLWLLGDLGIDGWIENAKKDRRTRYVGLFAHGELVGVGRITMRLNNEASGHIGYGIRPSKRGMGYASTMIRMMTFVCMNIGLENPTACVDVSNKKSISAFFRAGWTLSGRAFDWKPNPGPRKALEFVPIKYYRN